MIHKPRNGSTTNQFCIVCTLSFVQPEFRKDVPQSLKSFLQFFPIEINSSSDDEEEIEDEGVTDFVILNRICPNCTTRLQLLSQIISDMEMLRKNLDILKKSVEEDLTRDYSYDHNVDDRRLLGRKQFTFSPQEFREKLKKKLIHSSTESENTNGNIITVTVLPSSKDGNNASVSFQGVDQFEPNTIPSVPQISISSSSPHSNSSRSDVELTENDVDSQEEVIYEDIDGFHGADDINNESSAEDDEHEMKVEIVEEKSPEEIDLNESVSEDYDDHDNDSDSDTTVHSSVSINTSTQLYPEQENDEVEEGPEVTSNILNSNTSVSSDSTSSVNRCTMKPAIIGNKTTIPALAKPAFTSPSKNTSEPSSNHTISESDSTKPIIIGRINEKGEVIRIVLGNTNTCKSVRKVGGNSTSKSKKKSLPVSKLTKPKPVSKTKESISDDTEGKLRCTFTDATKGRCQAVYTDERRLDAHNNRIHLKLDPKRCFKCKQCPLGFGSLKYVLEHERRHTGEKDFLCEDCGNPFRTPRLLTHHRRKAHGEPYPYNCDVCQRGFNFKSYFLDHQQTHTGDHAFKCDQCGAGFARKKAFESHLLAHSRIYNFVCKQCPAKFQRKGGLDVHMRIHNNDRPYVCEVCDKGFLFPATLKVHKRVHSTDKPFVCQRCGWSTRHKEYLKIHVRNHEQGKTGRKRKTESRKIEEVDPIKDSKLNQKKTQTRRKNL